MRDIKTNISDKAQQATESYINNCIVSPIVGYTWSQAMRDAGYADSTIDKKSNETWGLVGVQQQIDSARVANRIETIDSVQKIRDKHMYYMLKAEKAGDLALARLNLQDLGRTYASYTDKAVIDNDFTLNIQRFTRQIASEVNDTPVLDVTPTPHVLPEATGDASASKPGKRG